MIKKIRKERIIFGEDFIQVKKGNKEIVYWIKQEWEENPDIVFSIANAISLAKDNKLEKKLSKFRRKIN